MGKHLTVEEHLAKSRSYYEAGNFEGGATHALWAVLEAKGDTIDDIAWDVFKRSENDSSLSKETRDVLFKLAQAIKSIEDGVRHGLAGDFSNELLRPGAEIKIWTAAELIAEYGPKSKG